MTKKKDLRNPGQAAFLAAYSQCCNLTEAARIAKTSRSQHYDWMDADESYPAAFALAHEEGCELLEFEARRRAMEGTEEPVIHQGVAMWDPKRDKSGNFVKDKDGKIVYERPLTVRRFSDTLLIFLLKAARPEKYRDNFRGEVKELFKSRVDLSSLSDEELAQLEALSRKASLKAA
jgi:hypothetical protein